MNMNYLVVNLMLLLACYTLEDFSVFSHDVMVQRKIYLPLAVRGAICIKQHHRYHPGAGLRPADCDAGSQVTSRR